MESSQKLTNTLSFSLSPSSLTASCKKMRFDSCKHYTRTPRVTKHSTCVTDTDTPHSLQPNYHIRHSDATRVSPQKLCLHRNL
ncbi:hypothetical protein NP493_449g00000 [Ridgeia piscesae]|uniref:Uncharacterized protein n=1 Tax=Ridgeia piscesae TaxID=27915 RepID=A0AAD9KYY8_RIDPI|nr:hypothetical protein NP493_449g00000 [Ridgeia piscesae]